MSHLNLGHLINFFQLLGDFRRDATIGRFRFKSIDSGDEKGFLFLGLLDPVKDRRQMRKLLFSAKGRCINSLLHGLRQETNHPVDNFLKTTVIDLIRHVSDELRSIQRAQNIEYKIYLGHAY